MKEKLYTIELMDAVKSGDECPFCYLERKLEQEAIEFVLGSSYMESDIRDMTDKQGFCRKHTKIMFDYGNSLGNAWILKSRMEYLRKQLKKEMEGFTPSKPSFFGKMKKSDSSGNGITSWVRGQESHCYVCGRVNETYRRMLDTFVYLAKKDHEFLDLIKQSKGFCIHHFGDLIEACEEGLGEKEKGEWFPVLFELTEKNLERVQGDINWFIEKYDYRNQDADWKDSKDAVQRTMQKIVGGYPADPVFKNQK